MVMLFQEMEFPVCPKHDVLWQVDHVCTLVDGVIESVYVLSFFQSGVCTMSRRSPWWWVTLMSCCLSITEMGLERERRRVGKY